MNTKRELRNLVEDLQEWHGLLISWGELRPEWTSQRMEWRRQDIQPADLAERIRAGLERLRCEL